ncbi:unnamed protein product [Ixodes persulcatus]
MCLSIYIVLCGGQFVHIDLLFQDLNQLLLYCMSILSKQFSYSSHALLKTFVVHVQINTMQKFYQSFSDYTKSLM